MTPEYRDQVMALAIGRLFRLASRATRGGDLAEYHRIRNLIFALSGTEPAAQSHTPAPGWNFGRGTAGCVE